jgi:hypothetical protein
MGKGLVIAIQLTKQVAALIPPTIRVQVPTSLNDGRPIHQLKVMKNDEHYQGNS